MRGLGTAVRFLTRLPWPGRPTEVAEISRAVGWFPVVGAFVGLIIAGVFWAASRIWPAAVAAILAVAVGLLITGGFHEDGATDATDGLGGGWTRERVLEIMKDSRIGAYGAMTLWCVLSFRAVSLMVLGERALVVYPVAMAWGRASVAFILRWLPPIGAGLAKEVHRELGWGTFLQALAWAVLAGLLGARLGLPHGLGAAGAGLGAILLWGLYLKHRLGGHTGDLLGAGNQLVEAVVLLAWML